MAAPVPAAAPLAAAEDAAALEAEAAALEAEALAAEPEALEAAELLDPDEQPARTAAMAVAAPTPMKLLLVKSFMFIPSLYPNLTSDAPLTAHALFQYRLLFAISAADYTVYFSSLK